MNSFKACMLLVAAAGMSACGEGPQAEGTAQGADGSSNAPQEGAVAAPAPDDAQAGPAGGIEFSGAVDHEIQDLGWTLTEHVPAAGTNKSGFDMMLYSRAEGRFKNVLGFRPIPWDVALNEPMAVGQEPGDAVIAAYFVADALDRTGEKWSATDGTLTFTEYGNTISGEFEVELSAEGRKSGLTARGSFSDIPMIQRP